MSCSVEDHTFTICTDKESSNLGQCILSLQNQTLKSKIIIATSNIIIQSQAYKYYIPVHRNEAGIQHTSDISTPIATIDHKNDVYEKTYAESVIKAICRCIHPLPALRNYSELRNNQEERQNKLLHVKRLPLAPLRNPQPCKSVLLSRRVLPFGSLIY